MTLHQVVAGQDTLLKYAEQAPLDAVAELVWNGLDADATEVKVNFETANLMADSETTYITNIEILDNGSGISLERADSEFLSHGDSWKKNLEGRTPSKTRILHGKLGRGRFFAFALGPEVKWDSVYDENGTRWSLTIRGNKSNVNEFDWDAPRSTKGPTGTAVSVRVPQGKAFPSLLAADVADRLSARFAPHLLGNPDIEVSVNGRRLDPRPLMAAEPEDITLEGLTDDELAGHDAPVLRVISWKPELKDTPAPIILCNREGAALLELPRTEPDIKALKRPGVAATCYVQWEGFAGEELATVRMAHPAVLDAAIARFAQFMDEKFEAVKDSIIEELVEEGAYPYKVDPMTNTERAERDLFDVVAVTAQPALKGSVKQRALSARLLRLAIEQRPEDLDAILNDVLDLPADLRQELADLLSRSSLPSIIKAMNEVTHRIDLLTALRALLYSTGESKSMREVDQLHPLVKDQMWLFGEHWKLAQSESSLTNVIRAELPATTALEESPTIEPVTQSDGRTGRVDLLMHRSLAVPGGYERLVVELKRPSVKLSQDNLAQVKRYAAALAKNPAARPGKWEFWLVGTSAHQEIEGDLDQTDRERGLIIRNDRYDVRVVTWGNLIDQRLLGLQFIRDQLNYSVDQEDALDRLRERYGSLIPTRSVTTAA